MAVIGYETAMYRSSLPLNDHLDDMLVLARDDPDMIDARR
jgi:hypothetical protein